jgi:hypothetical protein
VEVDLRRHEGPGVKRLQELEAENRRLKKLVAEQALDIDMLRDLAEGNCSPQPQAKRGAPPAPAVWGI